MNLNQYADKIEQAALGVRDFDLFIAALTDALRVVDDCRREDDYWRPWWEILDEGVHLRDRWEALEIDCRCHVRLDTLLLTSSLFPMLHLPDAFRIGPGRRAPRSALWLS